MRNKLLSILFSFFFIFISCEQESQNVTSPDTRVKQDVERQGGILRAHLPGNVVIANRASGTISVIDVASDKVSATYQMPDNGEPMYVVWSPRNKTVLVGDRANNRVVFFDSDDFSVKGTVEAGNGVFHMWAQVNSNDLWVVNDIDKTVSVIDIAAMQEKRTINLPADLVAMGGKPHDVITGPFGRLAYVTMLGFSGENDYVVQYDMRTGSELGRAKVGKDPHLSLHPRVNQNLYVPAQNSNALYIINRFTMETTEILDIPGAHGAGMAWNGRTFYTTNLPGGGAHGIFAVDTRSDNILGSVDTYMDNLVAVPHNIALNHNSKKLYLTHSGGNSNTVTVYMVDPASRLPQFVTEIEVGFNPFGLAYSN